MAAEATGEQVYGDYSPASSVVRVSESKERQDMKIEIKNRFDGKVIFGGDYASVKLCVEAAINAKISLSCSNLRCSDLSGSDLSGSDLSGSNLRCSDLSYSNLSGSNLSGSKGYNQSQDFFAQLVINHTIKFSISMQHIAFRIFALRLCWDSINKQYGNKMTPIFKIMADLGWPEYLEYWTEYKNAKKGWK